MEENTILNTPIEEIEEEEEENTEAWDAAIDAINRRYAEVEESKERIETLYSQRPEWLPYTSVYTPHTPSTFESFAGGVVEGLGFDPEEFTGGKELDTWDTVTNIAGIAAGQVGLFLGGRGALRSVAPGLRTTKTGRIGTEALSDAIAETPYFVGKYLRGEGISKEEVAITTSLLLGLNIIFGLKGADEIIEEAVDTASTLKSKVDDASELEKKKVQAEMYNNIPFEEGKTPTKLPKNSVPKYSTYSKYVDEGNTSAESLILTATDELKKANRILESPYYKATPDEAGKPVRTREFQEIVDTVVDIDSPKAVRIYEGQSLKNLQSTINESVSEIDFDTGDLKYLYRLLSENSEDLRNIKRAGWEHIVPNTVTRKVDVSKGNRISLEQTEPYVSHKQAGFIVGDTGRAYSPAKQTWDSIVESGTITHPPSTNAKAVEGLVERLKGFDKRLGYGVDTAMPDKQLTVFERRLRRLAQKEDSVRQSEALRLAYNDANKLLNTFKDPNVPRYIRPEFQQNEAWKLLSTPEGLNTLYEVAVKSGDRTAKELYEQVLDVGKEAFKRQREALDKRLGKIGRDLSAPELKTLDRLITKIHSGFISVDEVLAESMENGVQSLARASKYLAEATQREIDPVLDMIDPQIAAQVKQLDETASFNSVAEQMQNAQQATQLREQAAQAILSNPQLMDEVLGTPGINPKLKNSLELFRAVAGDERVALQLRDRMVKTVIDPHTDINASVKAGGIPEGALLDTDDPIVYNTAGAAPVPEGAASTLGTPNAQLDGEQLAKEAMEGAELSKSLTHNPAGVFRKNVMSAITYMGDLSKKVKPGSVYHTLLKRAEDVMNRLNQANRMYKAENQDWVDKLDTLTQRMESLPQNTKGVLLDTINKIDKVANDLYNVNRSDTTVRQAIDEVLSKQSDEVKAEYANFRNYLNEYRDYVNTKIDEFNISKVPEEQISRIPYREGYIPYIYRGEWRVTVMRRGADANKPIQLNSSEELADLLNGWRDEGWLKGPAPITGVRVEPKWFSDYDDWGSGDSLLKDGRAFEIDTSSLHKLMEDGSKFKGDNIADVLFHARHERKLNATALKEDLYASMALSGRLGVRFANFLEPLHQLKKVAVDSNQINFHVVSDTLEDYANSLTGRSGVVESGLDKALNPLASWVHREGRINRHISNVLTAIGFPPTDRATRALSSFITAWGRLTTIGFSPAAALLQYSILGTNVGNVLGYRTTMRASKQIGEYSKVNADGTLTRRAKLARRAGINMVRPYKQARKKGSMWVGGASGFESFGEGGLTKPKVLQKGGEKVWDAANGWGMALFNGAENSIRATTLEAALIDGRRRLRGIKKWKLNKDGTYKDANNRMLDELRVKGGYDIANPNDMEALLDDYAVLMNDKLNFDFDTGGISRLARDPVAKPYMQFKTFVTQEIEFLLGQKIPLTRTQQIRAWGMFGMLGGALGMPFASDIMAFGDWAFEVDMEKWMHDNAPDFVNYGLPALVGEGYSLRQMAGFPALIDSFQLTNYGVLHGKYDAARYNIETGRRGTGEAIARSSTLVDRLWQTAELTKHGRTFRGDYSVHGGLDTGISQLFGVKKLSNEKAHAQAMIERREKRAKATKTTATRGKIMKSKNPYRTALEEVRKGNLSPESANYALKELGLRQRVPNN